MPQSSALKMEAVWSSETLLSIYKSTRHYDPEDQHTRMMFISGAITVIYTRYILQLSED
jgi:hypothetical protein